ncbi:unnamed protein product [Brassicogethes aeneus]|uniref:Uncharacterized protein n=1 Tax=Brassicogethes aeneus TaxID=1431903 RepID=A0A9P0FPH6_BRAAE|nr:unnamed protein product [Brassicogethes aeneus]
MEIVKDLKKALDTEREEIKIEREEIRKESKEMKKEAEALKREAGTLSLQIKGMEALKQVDRTLKEVAAAPMSYAQAAGEAAAPGGEDPFRKDWDRIVAAANTLETSENAEMGALCRAIMSAQEAGMGKAIDGSRVPKPMVTRELRVEGSQSYDHFRAVEIRGWPADSFRGTEIVEVNPVTSTSEEVGLIIPCGMEDMAEGILAVARDRFPDLANNMEGEQILETYTKMGSIKRTKKILVARPNAEDPAEAMFQGMVELGEIAKAIGAEMLSLAAPAVTAVTARKMAACVLVAKLEILARVCVPKRQLRQAGITRPPLARQTSIKPKKIHRHEAVLIKGSKREEYPALLASARKALKGHDLRVADVHQTRDGHLLISLSEGSAKDVAKIITEGNVGEKVEALMSERRTTLMMSNIEAALGEADIRAAIVEQTGAAAEDIEVRDLRGGFKGKQTATVLAPAEISATILAHRGIIMGLTPASARPRVNIEKCHKCWKPGQVRRDGSVKVLPQVRQNRAHGR